MMEMTAKQAHVLEHLHRVRLLPYKVQVRTPSHRYQLDGTDCSQQVKSLAARRRIIMHLDGRLARCEERRTDKTGRQLALTETLDLLRETLLEVPSVHRDPLSASARARGAVRQR